MRNVRLGLCVVALLGAAFFLFVPPGYAQQALWPNLQPLPPFAFQLNGLSTGGREIRFSVTSYNWGLGPLELRAGETSSSGQNVYQRVYNSDGTYEDYFAGTFVWHPAHNHFHFGNYALYTLDPVNAPGGTQKNGSKTTFCIMDTTKIDTSLPGAPHNAVYSSCGNTVQGMSVGWGDTYGYYLEGQSIDITGNPSGDYCVTVTIDPKGRLCEADESSDCGSSTDNTASALVHLNVESLTLTVLDPNGCGAPAPNVTVAGITPNTGNPGTTFDVTIMGSGFTQGMSVSFANGTGGAPVVQVLDVDSNGTQITAKVTVKKSKGGKDPIWDLRVGPGTLPNAFTVVP